MTTPEFIELYDSLAEGVLRYVGRRVLDAEIAVDITAETFAQALAGKELYDPGRGPAEAWIFGIARNLVRHYLRHQRVVRSARQALGMPDHGLDGVEIERIEELIDAQTLQPQLADAMEGLAESQRLAVQRRVIDGVGYAELAAEAGCSEQVIRSRVSRGLRTMARELADSDAMSPDGRSPE